MITMDYTRQLDLAPTEDMQALEVHIVGLGGIGSPTSLLLAKLGVGRIVGYDFDDVEPVNLPSQLYRRSDARRHRPKALAMQDICGEFSEVEFAAIQDRANGHELAGVVVVGVDTMAARRDIFRAVATSPVDWLIDARMGAETGTIVTVRPAEPSSLLYYDSTLFDDHEALDLACTARAIIYNTFFLASLIGRQVKRIATGQPVERRIDFDLDTLNMIVEDD